MAIDPRELDNVRPSLSAVDRLKARKARIKPWQSGPIVAPSENLSTNTDSPNISLNAVTEPPQDAPLSPTKDMPHLEIEVLNGLENNADTEPAQYRHENLNSDLIGNSSSDKSAGTVSTQKESPTNHHSRHNTDTEFTDVENNGSTNIGTIPTQDFGSIELKSAGNGSVESSADTMPAQKGTDTNSVSSSITDTKIATRPESKNKNIDTVPTQKSRPLEIGLVSDAGEVPTQNNFDREADNSVIGTDTIPAQIRHDTDTKPIQSGHRSVTKQTQTRHRASTVPAPNQTQNFQAADKSTDTNLSISENVKGDIEAKYRLLRGLKLQLIDYCAKTCIRINANTIRTTYEALAASTLIPLGSIRTTAKRLRDDGLINIYAPIKGPGAFVELILPEIIIRTAARSLLDQSINADTVTTQRLAESQHNTDTHSVTNVSSSSSSSLNIKNTTNWEVISEAWENIEFSRLSNIGFTISHVKQVATQGILTPEQLQESIDYFAFDLTENARAKRIKGSELNFFIGILRRGSPYTPPANFVSEKERALKAVLERKRAESERLKKLQDEIIEFDFEEWVSKLSASEKLTKVQESDFAKLGTAPYRAMLKQYFIDNEWKRGT